MTVYKYFIKSFARKKKLFVIWIGIFAIITYLIAGIPSNNLKKDFEKPMLKIAISNELDDKIIKEFIETFKEKTKFIEIENSEYKAKEAVFLDGADLALIKDKDSPKTLIYSNPADANTYLATEKLESYINFARLTNTKNEDGIEKARELAKVSIKPKIVNKKNMAKYDEIWYYFEFRFLAYPLMAVIMGIIGLGIISFKSRENQARTKISAMPILKLKLAGFLAQFVATIFIICLVLVIILMMGGQSNIEYLAHFTNIFAFGISSLGLIFLLSHINSNKDFIASIGNILPLCLAFISGVFVDLNLLPKLAINISRAFPTFYYIKGNELAQNGFSKDLYFYIAIQLLFALCYFLLAVLIDKTRASRVV